MQNTEKYELLLICLLPLVGRMRQISFDVFFYSTANVTGHYKTLEIKLPTPWLNRVINKLWNIHT